MSSGTRRRFDQLRARYPHAVNAHLEDRTILLRFRTTDEAVGAAAAEGGTTDGRTVRIVVSGRDADNFRPRHPATLAAVVPDPLSTSGDGVWFVHGDGSIVAHHDARTVLSIDPLELAQPVVYASWQTNHLLVVAGDARTFQLTPETP